jgi:ankyrin repeat protein
MPIHQAAAHGKVSVLRLLISAGVNVDAPSKDGMTALHYAAFRGKSETIDYLLSCGADVNHKDKNGWTALHRATFSGKLEALNLLAKRGANANVIANDGKTPLDVAVIKDDTNLNLNDALRSKLQDSLKQYGGQTGDEIRKNAK